MRLQVQPLQERVRLQELRARLLRGLPELQRPGPPLRERSAEGVQGVPREAHRTRVSKQFGKMVATRKLQEACSSV